MLPPAEGAATGSPKPKSRVGADRRSGEENALAFECALELQLGEVRLLLLGRGR